MVVSDLTSDIKLRLLPIQSSSLNPSPASLFQREESRPWQEFPLFKRGIESDLIVLFWSFGHWRLENYLRFGLALAGLEFGIYTKA